MSSLLEAYFIRDLSVAEDEELAQILAASPDEALRFAALAQADWKRLGLPEPLMKRAGLKHGWKLGAGAAVIAAMAAWNQHSAPPEKIRPDLALEGVAFQSGAARPRPGAPNPQSAAPERLVATTMPGSKGRFMLQLLNARAEESAAVYDASGKRLKGLSSLGSNRWIWDGRLASGLLAPPGRYQLKLERGDDGKSKWVEIEAR